MKMILIGAKQSKRTEYFQKAAKDLQTPISVMEWKDILHLDLTKIQDTGIKIDPPSYHTCSLTEMSKKIKEYQSALQYLSQIKGRFLNSPETIRMLLDKRICKEQLQQAGVPVTKMFAKRVNQIEQLITLMRENKVYSVFIKPLYFSGAAGVTAFRLQPHTKKMVVYTSCKWIEGQLVNTKTLYCIEDTEEIYTLVNAILQFDVLIERWYPKALFQGKSFDLRVVYQFGHIANIVVRQSNGPITNLHLNNQAADIKELGLSQKQLDDLEELCAKAVNVFPGLSMAGIDILFEKNSNQPYIIEMNGQGDLIYQDIYHENQIYKEQICWLSQYV